MDEVILFFFLRGTMKFCNYLSQKALGAKYLNNFKAEPGVLPD